MSRDFDCFYIAQVRVNGSCNWKIEKVKIKARLTCNEIWMQCELLQFTFKITSLDYRHVITQTSYRLSESPFTFAKLIVNLKWIRVYDEGKLKKK